MASSTSTRVVASLRSAATTAALVAALPDEAVESFAGVASPFALRSIDPGEHVVDVGSGAGMDSFLAARMVGPEGRVAGVEMTPEMLTRRVNLHRS